METEKNFERHIAIKTVVKNILESKYIQEKENNPNYLLTDSGEKIYRLNLMGIILSKETQGSVVNILIDDGTGKITLRFFEENKIIDSLNVGDPVLTIGRLRIYNQEKYISPEIIKKVNPVWLKLRGLELKKLIDEKPKVIEEEKEINDEKINPETSVEDVKEEIKIEEESFEESEDNENEDILPVEKIKKLIQEMDEGNGVLIEELISKSMLNETEKLIEKMLEVGDIFQNLPGKVKVL